MGSVIGHVSLQVAQWNKKRVSGTVVILPLVHMGYLELTFSSLKQLILDQARQNGYQTVPFGVYIHNLMFVFFLE